jgi:hypothetical protein
VLAPALRRPCSLQLPCLLNANSYLADEKVYSNICKNAHFMDFYLLIIENIRIFAAN